MEQKQTEFLIKLDGEILADHTLHFTKVADENGFITGGDSENLLQDSAQLTAQAAAIVNSRIKGLQGKGNTSDVLNLVGDSFSTSKPSKVIKIINGHDRYAEFTTQKFQEMFEDMMEMFPNYAMIKVIRANENYEEDSSIPYSNILAEVGSVFIEFETEDEAKAAKDLMKAKIYDGREVKAIFVPEGVYKSLNLK